MKFLFVLVALRGFALADDGTTEPKMAKLEEVIAAEGSGIRLFEVVDDLLNGDISGRYRRQAESEATTTGAATTEATTTEGTTTTTAASTTIAVEENVCKASTSCEDDGDCNGGKCRGFFSGRCNCGACIGLLACKGDEGCGGLQGACNMTTQRCNCVAAFAQHGYATRLDARQNFCNKKTCKANECNGLKCHKGSCKCPGKN